MKNQKVRITADSLTLAKDKARAMTPSGLSIRKEKIISKGQALWGLLNRGKKAEIEVVFGGDKCAKCGRSWAALEGHFAEIKAKGGFIYGEGVPVLLYCEKCRQSFCGSCQADLNYDSGCPNCRNPLSAFDVGHY